jgi:chemotaxis response regulator CheB
MESVATVIGASTGGVVFGMPRQAIAAGAVHDVLPLKEVGARLVGPSRA